MRRADRLLFLAAALLIAVYFFFLVRPGFRAYFSPDDTMNLYKPWVLPVLALVRANVLFFISSPYYRPFAAAWYGTIFRLVGFNPFPFHTAYFVILLTNVFWTYAVARRLSGSREIAAVTALIASYHPRMSLLYFDTAYVYDALAYFCYFAALLLVIRARQQQRLLRAWELAACCVIYVCALNSKEIAVTLPVTLLVYELLYSPPAAGRLGEICRWPLREGRTVFVTGIITLAFVIGRSRGSESLMSMSAYRPVISWRQFLLCSGHFLGDVFSEGKDWASLPVLALWASLFAIAWASRSRVLKFSWLFLMLAPLPVAFIPPRGASQYYLPWFGWVLFGSTVLVRSLDGVLRDGIALTRIRGGVLLVALVLVLYPYYREKGWSDATSVSIEAPVIRDIVEQIHALYPQLQHGARLYFKDDPLKSDRWDLLFAVRESYRDESIIVDRGSQMDRAPDESKLASYNHVLDFRVGQLFEMTRPWTKKAIPMIVRSAGVPEVFHQGWIPVTDGSPAKGGEVLIVKATDLGATTPPVPDDKPFPPTPLRPVASAIMVRVNGLPAEVTLQIGWPEMVDTYRLDFRVPQGTSPGRAKVQITAGGSTGPAVPIPLQ
jgi:hypothetical protein